MKKLLSFFMAAAILLTFAVPPGIATEDASYVRKSFYNFSESTLPTGVEAAVGSAAVVTLDTTTGADNVYYGNTVKLQTESSAYATARFPFEEFTSDNLEELGANAYAKLSMDIKASTTDASRLMYIRLYNAESGGTKIFELTLYPNKEIFTCTNASSSMATTKSIHNTWVNLALNIKLTNADATWAGEVVSIKLDGEEQIPEGTASFKMNISSVAAIKRMAFSFQQTDAVTVNVDNVELISYNDADGVCPAPDRFAFRTSIDVCSAQYDAYLADGITEAQLANAKTAIDSAKALYNSADLTKTQCDEALSAIEAELSKIDPDPSDYVYSFDFETEESKTAYNSITNYTLTEKTNVDTYGIGTHYAYPYSTGNRMYFYFPTAINRLSSKMRNKIMEVEFDMATANSSIKNGGFAIKGINTAGEEKYVGGIQYEQTTTDIHGWWKTSTEKIATWEAEKWHRFKIVYKLNEDGAIVATDSHDIYVDGVKQQTFSDCSADVTKIAGFEFPIGNGTIWFDNLKVSIYENTDAPAEKGALVAKMRAFYDLYKADYKHYSDVEALFTAAETVYKNEGAAAGDVTAAIADMDNACAKMETYLESLSALGTEIQIPSTGVAANKVTIPFMLHYGEQEGDENFKDIFFDKTSRKDFSDVEFVDRFGNVIQSEIISTGNYDFIRDSSLGYNYTITHLQDGTLATTKDGYVAFSSDNGVTWEKTAHRGNAEFVDRNNNLYYNVTKDRGDGQAVGVYKLSAEDNYETAKLVIDCSTLIDGTENAGITDRPDYLKSSLADGDEVIFDASNMAQDDDGYLYFGRYQTTWVGVRLYVSDESGENFKCVDWRIDKQHNHAIRINRHVYPNEVYVTYDDTKHSPLCQVTTTHAGYDLIKDDPDYDDTNYEDVLALSQTHFEQVPVPYQNADFLGYFGVIDKSEEKFYTAENGNRYTTADNIFAIGNGEANILGGPTLYKTTDVWNQSEYYPLVETTHGSRNVLDTPVSGMIMSGLLSGRYAQTEHVVVSFDEGETWTTAFSEGINYSNGAGNGAMRNFTDYFTPKGADEAQMIGFGYGKYCLRAKFGGDNYSALCMVTLDSLSEIGDKIFVRTNGADTPVYEYALNGIRYIDDGGKSTDEAPSSGLLSSINLERTDYTKENALLIAAAYDADGRVTQVKTADVTESGSYDMNLTLASGGSHKIFMLDEWNVLRPLITKSYVPKNQRENVVVDNNLLNPVVRLKLDEGSGNKVSDSVSGNEYTIDGAYEWIDTQIRYGNMLPIQTRSTKALKLDPAASINLGEIEALKNIDFSKEGSDITIAFWTNTEVFGQKDGYEETDPYHLSDSYGHIRCGNKYSNTHYDVLFQIKNKDSEAKNFEFAMKYNSVFFRGTDITNNDGGYRVPQPLLDTNYYNLYFVTVKGGDTVTVQTYGNDQKTAAANAELTLGEGANFSFDGDLYIGAADGATRDLISKGLADIMIFDRELTYAERIALYHGINHYGAIGTNAE